MTTIAAIRSGKDSSMLLICIMTLMYYGCREPYDPSLDTPDRNYLVVEGFINGNGVSHFQLSRSQKMSDKSTTKPELKGSLVVESEDNHHFPFTESGNGQYVTGHLTLPARKKYRVRIKTADGKEYLSDFSEMKVSPALEVDWERTESGLNIYASTSDPTKNTIYYRYDYDEVWEIRSPFRSKSEVISRKPRLVLSGRGEWGELNAYLCWKGDSLKRILTISTAAQSDDIVDKLLVNYIPGGSEKLSVRYSINVSQHALSKEAYEYYELMKKNTQQLGSVFDPQPVTVQGNIRSVSDPHEFVVGYVTASVVSGQRIFIERDEAKWRYEILCPGKLVANDPDSLALALSDPAMGVGDVEMNYSLNPPTMMGYWVLPLTCVDCRTRGGTNVRPSFW